MWRGNLHLWCYFSNVYISFYTFFWPGGLGRYAPYLLSFPGLPSVCVLSGKLTRYFSEWTFMENEPCKSIKVFRAYLTALACYIEEMRDTNKNKLVPNNAQGRRQIMKFNLPILGSSPAGNSIQTETHKFSQTNSQPRPQIFTQPLKYHCVLH